MNVKHPCQGCIYFKQCGETTRTMPCAGRKTKSEKKREEKKEKTSAFISAMAYGMNTASRQYFAVF